jgi:PKD repeat protein
MVCEEERAGWTNVTDLCQNVTVVDTNETATPFVNTPDTYCINGTKTDNCTAQPLSGWTIRVTHTSGEVGTDVTDEYGFYEICGLLPGIYTICEDPEPGYTNITPVCQEIEIVDTNATVDFLNQVNTGNITGRKIGEDCNCGLANWQITLSYANNGTVYDTQMTLADGSYAFNNVPLGTYYLNETPQVGWIAVNGNTTVTIGCDTEISYDFINTEVCCESCPTVPRFSFAKTTIAKEIKFTDESSGYPVQWYWKFGDGKTSTEQNPTHLYPYKKTYTVVLYVKGVNCEGIVSPWTSYTKSVTVT